MVKNTIVRATAVAVTSLGLLTGFAGIAGASAGTGTIDTTGPYSTNRVTSHNTVTTTVRNRNRLNLSATSSQTSHTGNANVNGNTLGGDAMTGAAMNNHTLGGTVSVTNTAPTVMSDPSTSTNDGSITLTGPHSLNVVSGTNTTTTTVTNDNNVSLNTHNTQTATSGNANVNGNTSGGSATSGDASNTSSSTFDVTISN